MTTERTAADIERTDPGPVPDETPAEVTAGSRARRIAAMHAFADWFTAHPDVAPPTSLTASYYITKKDEPDPFLRAQPVHEFAKAYDIPVTTTEFDTYAMLLINRGGEVRLGVQYSAREY